jgi:hypothetical protein
MFQGEKHAAVAYDSKQASGNIQRVSKRPYGYLGYTVLAVSAMDSTQARRTYLLNYYRCRYLWVVINDNNNHGIVCPSQQYFLSANLGEPG